MPRRTFNLMTDLINAIDGTVDTKKQHDAVGVEVLALTDDLFINEEDPEGDPWKDLEESTKQQRKGTTYAILQDRGLLRGGCDFVASRPKVTVGSDRPEAIFHNEGLGVPQRGVLPVEKLPKRYQAAITAVITGELRKQAGRA